MISIETIIENKKWIKYKTLFPTKQPEKQNDL